MHTSLPPSPRHLNLSQTVTLTIVTAGDALERAKLFRRYIEVAQLLQSSKYGNLFSFVGVMQGLAAPQVCETPPNIPPTDTSGSTLVVS